jgi:hypothetical protein
VRIARAYTATTGLAAAILVPAIPL